jgi:hypothetical protein
MNRHHILGFSVITAVGLALLSGNAIAQQKSLKDHLTGAWTLVSIVNTMPDGKKQEFFGPNPKGLLVFDASGRYSQAQVRAGRPKFQSANRLDATPAEAKAAVNDSLAQFGGWSVDEASKTIVLRIEGSLVPNAEGTEGKRINVSVTADELKFSNAGPATGGRNDSVYRRAK